MARIIVTLVSQDLSAKSSTKCMGTVHIAVHDGESTHSGSF